MKRKRGAKLNGAFSSDKKNNKSSSRGSDSPEKKHFRLFEPSESGSSEKKVASIFGSPKKGSWGEVNHNELLFYTSFDCENRAKIAGFDMGMTLNLPLVVFVDDHLILFRWHFNQDQVRQCVPSKYR